MALSLGHLDENQKQAVLFTGGPLLVLAGAGSGKTRVLTHRIAHLVLEAGVRPDQILAVSFTNKAAEEMGERMVPLVGAAAAQKLWLSTFHSFGVRFVREESKALFGEAGRFSIFDQGDAVGLVREIAKREGLLDRKMDLWAVLARISLWKNKMVGPSAVKVNDAVEYDRIAAEVYPHYEAALRSMRALDFDDLVVRPAALLQKDAALRERWAGRFRHLMVDEFQDTNVAQMELVKALTPALRNVMVVGEWARAEPHRPAEPRCAGTGLAQSRRMRSSMVLAFLLSVALPACTTASPASDVPVADAGPTDTGPADTGGAEGGMCSGADGLTTCSGGYGTTCCGGITRGFADGPCFPRPDAGAGGSPCATDPTAPGCFCATEGERSCPTGGWRRTCEGAVWVEQFGFMCC